MFYALGINKSKLFLTEKENYSGCIFNNPLSNKKNTENYLNRT